MGRKRIIVLILSVLASSVFGEEPINIPDPNLKAAIEATLRVSDPNATDMLKLTSLINLRPGKSISDLTGLEYAINLTSLDLKGNQIKDILPLAGLTNLQRLCLIVNQISDISPLAGLANLTELGLAFNKICDISSLAGLTNLQILSLSINQISDISPLSGLTNLQTLSLSINQVSDISPLARLTNLTYLDLVSNQINNISPIRELTDLTTLDIRNNQLSDISPLKEMVNLKKLFIEINQITDITALSGMVNLEWLWLDRNQISDISALSGLTKLIHLDLYTNQISDISPLAELINLKFIELQDNLITDVSSLKKLVNLEDLDLTANMITDISPLKELTKLQSLYLSRNQISDITSLAKMTKLTDLWVGYTQVSDVSSLAEMTNLKALWLSYNNISDISPLANLRNLTTLVLTDNPLNADAYNYYIPLHKSYGTNVSYDPLLWRSLMINSTTGGSVTSPGEGNYDYTNLTIVNIEAQADLEYYFIGWTGTSVEAGKVTNPDSAKATVIMDANYTLVANFRKTRIIYVDDNATVNNDGSSWENAYNFLQDALADANSAEKPVEIRVAQGIYKPDKGHGLILGDRAVTFQLINNVNLVGGYSGFSTDDPNARDFELYQTILSGDLNGNDIDVNEPNDLLDEPTRAENSYHVVNGSGTSSATFLNGFTITGGNASGEYTNAIGGGIYIFGASPTVANCTFSENSANYYGGGMSNDDESNPSITNCTFSHNSAQCGGGIYNYNSNPLLINCDFISNEAKVIDDQYSTLGGGICNDTSDPNLTNCTFIENSAQYGGGMCNSGSSSCPTIANCTFSGNSANYGGGMYNYSSSNPNITNCTFSGNTANYNGGGMYNNASSPYITNCIFSENIANYGGGMYNNSGSPNITKCTFNINTANNNGGGMRNHGASSQPTLINCIVWANIPNQLSGSGTAKILYSNIQGGWSGTGNINADPLFANPNNGDYHLKSQVGRWDPTAQSWVQDDVTSPCIDAGDPNSDWGEELWPHGKRINMGAYGGTTEASMSLSNTGDSRDLNNDDLVNWDDVLLFADKWDSNDAPLKEDLDRNGSVDVNDLTFFYGNWMQDSNNAVPVFDVNDEQKTTAGNELRFSISALDNDGDNLIYIAAGLPEGAEFKEQVFKWTPEQAGTYLVTFIVSDYKSLDYITVRIIVF